MLAILRNTPIPLAGVALAFAAFAGLLQKYSEVAFIASAFISALLILFLLAKVVLCPHAVRQDMGNPQLASVSGTLLMAIMQQATFLRSIAFDVSLAIWSCACALQLALLIWFSVKVVRAFNLKDVVPSYLICYVGIVVAAVTGMAFSLDLVSRILFWTGVGCFPISLSIVLFRYRKHPVPEPAKPLFFIFAAPISLILVGYIAVFDETNPYVLAILLIASQGVLLFVCLALPRFISRDFKPSFSAMTFPFVISATALDGAFAYYRDAGYALPQVFDWLLWAEIAVGAVLSTFVLVHYIVFLAKLYETKPKQTDA